MVQVIRFFLHVTLLLTVHAAARHLGSQAPFTASVTSGETQPHQIGSFDSTKSWPNQYNCSNNPRVAYDNSHGGIITALLTFQFPAPGKYKYCWLEFYAPNPSKPGDGTPRVIVRWFKPGQSCPAPTAIERQSDLGVWLLAGGKGGNATWDNRWGSTFLNWPMQSRCPEGGGIVGIEIAPPQGANFDLAWNQDPKLKGQGVRLLYSN